MSSALEAIGLPPPPPFVPEFEKTRNKYAKSQIKIEALLVVSFTVIVLIVLLGWLRSRVKKGWLKICTTKLLLPLSRSLLTYVPGLMDESKYSNDLFALWMSFLIFLGALASNFNCYSLGDNEDRRVTLLADYLIPWGAIGLSLYNRLAGPQVMVPVVVIFWLVILKLRERRDALNHATRSSLGLVRSTKVIYDFMKAQQKNNHSDVEDSSQVQLPPYKHLLVGVREARSLMENYSGEELDKGSRLDPLAVGTGSTPWRGLLAESDEEYLSKFITWDNINRNKEALERMSPPGENLTDISLSFALFWLLLAKVAGYNVVTSVCPDLLLLHERAFDVIEMELGFLHDYLYTNYYAIYARGLKSKFRHLALVILFLWLAFPLLTKYRPQEHSLVYVVVSGHVLDVGITRFVILAVVLVEFAQIILVFTSKWAKVVCVCTYLGNGDKWEKMGGKFLEKFNKCVRPIPFFSSAREIAQYSIIESYDLMPCRTWIKSWLDGFMDLPKLGQKGINYTPLSLSLKEAFTKYVKRNGRKLSNGTTSLRVNYAENLVDRYICNLESHSHVILVWHIATHFCQMDSGNVGENHHSFVATTLSKYCAYLVAFAPKFLPDNDYIVQCAFDDAIEELLAEQTPIECGLASYELADLEGESSNSRTTSILELARHLAREIKRTPDPFKLLSDFWTELLLYLARSNNFETIEVHAEYLCAGGELITLLWALSNHLGCYREHDVRPINQTREDE